MARRVCVTSCGIIVGVNRRSDGPFCAADARLYANGAAVLAIGCCETRVVCATEWSGELAPPVAVRLAPGADSIRSVRATRPA